MNKKIIGLLLAIPALMGFGLTSCSDEESMAIKETAQERLVDVTLTASLTNSTRASFDPEGNIIKFKWEKDDIVNVVNKATGKWLGKLTVSKVLSDPRTCIFAGQIMIAPGDIDLNFYYLGKEGSPEFNSDLTVKPYVVDFSNQDGNANFAKDDVLIATAHYADASDGKLGTLDFSRDFAYGRFILKHNGEEVDLTGKTVTISANTGKLYNKTSLDFKNAEYSYEEGSINITPSSNSFYVSLFKSEAVNLKFTVDMGNNTIFEGTIGRQLDANMYYTENEAGDPTIVEVKNTDGSDDPKIFMIHYNLYDGDQGKWVSKQVEESIAADNYEMTIKNIDEVFTDYEYDKDIRTLAHWSTNYNNSGQILNAGDSYTFDFNDATTGTIKNKADGTPRIYIQLYAQINYTYKFELDEDVEVVGLDTNDVVYTSNSTISWYYFAKLGVKVINKDGYSYIGWKDKETNEALNLENNWYKVLWSQKKAKVTLVPIWQKNGNVETGGYEGGTLD